ncbi:MAG: polysaccharide deacetylase family protein [Bdellovibrionota bacterium]
MKSNLILILAALLVYSCAASPTIEPTRGLAQVSEPQSQEEKLFQDLWATQAPANEFMRQVGRTVSLYLRAQKYLLDFDKELTGDLNALNRSESYRKLQVLREMQETQVGYITFLYGRVIDMEQSDDPEAKKKAGNVLSSLGRYMLSNRSKLNRLAMQDVVQALRAVREERKQKSAELEGIEFKTPEEITAFLNQKEGDIGRREALAAAAQKEAVQVDPEFDQAFVDSEKAEAKAARDPQAQVNFAPNPGRSGNLMGHELPMGTFAITFDDGPHLEYTPQILKVFHDAEFKTSFFWLAKNLAGHRKVMNKAGQTIDDIVTDARKAGHTLGNHSYSHADLSKPEEVLAHLDPPTSLDKEINVSTAIDTEVYGVKPSYFRCPYGSCIFKNTTKVREMIAAQRMLHVTWTIDSLDWQDKDPASVYSRVMKQVLKNGRGIILFHDIHPQSLAASTMVVNQYFAKHRDEVKLKSISQIVRELNSLPPISPPNVPPPETPSILKWLPWGRSE